MPTVSIITPVYNSAPFLEETIQSVLNQSFEDWEMILVDDCSTDNSRQIIQRIASQDPRLIFMENENNLGQIKTRNRAIERASGRYIAMLDSDDVWHPQKLEKQLAYFEDTGCAIQHAYYEQIDENSNPLKLLVKAPIRINYRMLLRSNYLGCLTVIYDTQKVGKTYMPEVGRRDDWACWLSILKQGHEAHCIPEVLAYYRLRKNSLSSNKLEMLYYNWRILTIHQGISKWEAIFYMGNHIFRNIVKSIKLAFPN